MQPQVLKCKYMKFNTELKFTKQGTNIVTHLVAHIEQIAYLQ